MALELVSAGQPDSPARRDPHLRHCLVCRTLTRERLCPTHREEWRDVHAAYRFSIDEYVLWLSYGGQAAAR